ncbi:hypothetical protein Dimus_018847 [Dionaea muscipula]
MDSSQVLRGVECDTEEAEAVRLNPMVQEMSRLAYRASPFKEGYLAFMEGAIYTSELVEASISRVMVQRAFDEGCSKVASNVPPSATNLSHPLILDPHVSQKKGGKKEVKGKDKVHTSATRMKSGLEEATTRNKRLCGCCHKYRRHEKRNCPKNPNNRNKGLMGIDSSTDDDEYGNEENEQMDDDSLKMREMPVKYSSCKNSKRSRSMLSTTDVSVHPTPINPATKHQYKADTTPISKSAIRFLCEITNASPSFHDRIEASRIE